MKRFLTLMAGILALLMSAAAQEADSVPTDSLTVAPADTVAAPPRYQIGNLYTSSEQLEQVVAQGVKAGIEANENKYLNRYKLYPTENMWTFLKLDTCIGSISQVQYNINSDNRWQSMIVYTPLEWEELWEAYDDIGRFELYPTQNTYNFLLLDKKSGRIWQIQWSTNSDSYEGIVAELK